MRHVLLASAVGEKAIVANAVEARRQHVEQKAPDELLRCQGHRFPLVAISIVGVVETDLPVADAEQAIVRDRDPVRDRIRPDCGWIHRELKRVGVTLQLLWEEYAQAYPDGYRTASSARSTGSGRAGCGRRCARCIGPARRHSSISRERSPRSSIGAPARSAPSSSSSRCSEPAPTPSPRRPPASSCPTGWARTPAWSSSSAAPRPSGSPTSSRAPSPGPAAMSRVSIGPTRNSPRTMAPSWSRRAPRRPGTRRKSKRACWWPSAGSSPGCGTRPSSVWPR